MNGRYKIVMAGLVPAIHALAVARWIAVDARDKPGHDDLGWFELLWKRGHAA